MHRKKRSSRHVLNALALAIVAAMLLLTAGCAVSPQERFQRYAGQMETIKKTVIDRLNAVSKLPEDDNERVAACRECADQLVLAMRLTEDLQRWCDQPGRVVIPYVLVDFHDRIESEWSRVTLRKVDEELIQDLEDDFRIPPWILDAITSDLEF